LLRTAGIEYRSDYQVTTIDSEATLKLSGHSGRWSSGGIVFAPSGTEPGLNIEGGTELHGFGISYSASADAPFFASRRVGVYGDAPRAIEHALVAARFAEEVVLLLKGVLTPTPPALIALLGASSKVSVFERVTLQGLRASGGFLAGVRVDTPAGAIDTDLSALFVAQHLEPSMDVMLDGSDSSNVVFAGMAAGVPYWKHAALVENGARAAERLIARRLRL
jgi:thioredoxin reductase